MKRAALLIAAVLAANLSASARADWQWTKWGMTPDEVIAASGGKARRATEEETKGRSFSANERILSAALVVGEHSAGDLRFDATFRFSPTSQRLQCVSLTPKNSTARSLRDSLVNVYGVPVEDKHQVITEPVIRAGQIAVPGVETGLSVWLSDDRIELFWVKTSQVTVRLDYCPRNTSAGGL